jgi:hypothetical protein
MQTTSYTFVGTRAGTLHSLNGCMSPQSKHWVKANCAPQCGPAWVGDIVDAVGGYDNTGAKLPVQCYDVIAAWFTS